VYSLESNTSTVNGSNVSVNLLNGHLDKSGFIYVNKDGMNKEGW